jgi:mersacidin/lichenicidin family type 2 lantibiotic
MKNNSVDIIRAWKDPIYRSTLSDEQLAGIPSNPAGDALSDIETAMITGGAQDFQEVPDIPPPGSEGWFCTISGECNGGFCCNPFTSR